MFFYSRIPPHVFRLKKDAKEMTVFFIYDNYINFIYTWGNFDRSIKVTPGMIKVTPSAIKVTPFDGITLIGLWFRISSKKLIITYSKGIEHKANYHIVLHSVAGACVMLHIFKTFKKPPKSIKVTPFHGTYSGHICIF